MLLDNENLFCENQEITSGEIYSQNIINFGKNDVSFAPVVVQAVADFTGLNSLKVVFETSIDSDFSDAITLAESTLSQAELKAGATYPIAFLPKGNKGYMRLKFVVDGVETTGKMTSGVVSGNGLSISEI
jgi:hypothetical protein